MKEKRKQMFNLKCSLNWKYSFFSVLKYYLKYIELRECVSKEYKFIYSGYILSGIDWNFCNQILKGLYLWILRKLNWKITKRKQ